jgi:hypothetical protein
LATTEAAEPWSGSSRPWRFGNRPKEQTSLSVRLSHAVLRVDPAWRPTLPVAAAYPWAGNQFEADRSDVGDAVVCGGFYRAFIEFQDFGVAMYGGLLHTLTDAQNSTDLIAAFSGIDVAVPARTEGRKTHHSETYIACRRLSTLAKVDRLTFPLSVSRHDPPNDRPDVVMRTGSGQIGIEITEAIPERFSAMCALAEKEFPDRWLNALFIERGPVVAKVTAGA